MAGRLIRSRWSGQGSGNHGHGQALAPQVSLGQAISFLGGFQVAGQVLRQHHLHDLLQPQHGDGLPDGIDFDRQAHVGGVDRLQQVGGDGRIPLDHHHQVFQRRFRVVGEIQDFVNDRGNRLQPVYFFQYTGQVIHRFKILIFCFAGCPASQFT
jgi:hypothetical protein